MQCNVLRLLRPWDYGSDRRTEGASQLPRNVKRAWSLLCTPGPGLMMSRRQIGERVSDRVSGVRIYAAGETSIHILEKRLCMGCLLRSKKKKGC